MHRTLHFYLVSKGLPDVKPFLVNLLVVRAILPEKGVHVRNMALAAQVVEAIPDDHWRSVLYFFSAECTPEGVL